MSDHSLSSSNQYGLMIPCFDMATQAVHLMECNGCCRPSSRGVEPQKSSHGLRGGIVIHLRTTNCPENQGSHQPCHRTSGR